MVAHFTMRIYGVNQVFRFVEGIRLHRKSRIFFSERPILIYTCATCSELPFYISTMAQPMYLDKPSYKITLVHSDCTGNRLHCSDSISNSPQLSERVRQKALPSPEIKRHRRSQYSKLSI